MHSKKNTWLGNGNTIFVSAGKRCIEVELQRKSL